MSKTVAYIDFIRDQGDGVYKLEGYLGGASASVEDLRFQAGGEVASAVFVDRKNTHDGIEYDRPLANGTFEVLVTPSTPGQITAHLRHTRIAMRMNRFTGLSRLAVSYRIENGKLWSSRRGRVSLAPYDRWRHVLLELATILCVVTNWRIVDVGGRLRSRQGVQAKLRYLAKAPVIIAEAIVTILPALAMRCAYWSARKTKRRPIWILSDRPAAAGDNGEALYRYLRDSGRVDEDVDYYFAISKKSPDYQRLASLGKVLDYGSFRYKLMVLLSDMIISSQADIETTNPFGRQINRYVDLFHFRFVFLQHGIIRHDLSDWLNRFNRAIDLFVTSARQEYDSIVSGEYCYSEDQVTLSGLPRYDLLQSNPANKLILAPTYRANLLSAGTNHLGERPYDEAFKDSEYAVFYRNFMNDTRLIECMRQHNFTGELYLHPVFKNQARDFTENDVFHVVKFPYDYAKAFEQGSLLVSDHSSVMFDFAYLKKPVLYAHFDADTFYATHTYTKSEFFDDEKQGFGPVCSDYDSLVMQTIRAIEQGATMSMEYQHRVEVFFEYNDKSNSKRVLDAILRIGTTHGE